jgi:hypothetical protein
MTKVLGWERFIRIFDQELFDRILWGFGLGLILRAVIFIFDRILGPDTE